MIPHVLALVLLFSAAGTPAQALSDSEKVHIVFPFEVGQQYQFKSSGNFYRPNGEIWPADSVVTITITDTLIDGKTYLHIPFWSPFGTEYYRYDETYKLVVQYSFSWERDYGMMYVSVGRYPKETFSDLLHWSYPDAYDPDLFECTPRHCPGQQAGWMEAGGDSALRFEVVLGYSQTGGNPAVYTIYGEGVPGTCYHMWERVGTDLPPLLWGLFRPMTTDPWPNFDKMVSVGEPATYPTRVGLTLFPNPFNPNVTVAFDLPTTAFVRLTIYNVAGQQVRTLIEDTMVRGNHHVVWDGRDRSGRYVGTGVYLIRLTTPQTVIVRKATLVR